MANKVDMANEVIIHNHLRLVKGTADLLLVKDGMVPLAVVTVALLVADMEALPAVVMVVVMEDHLRVIGEARLRDTRVDMPSKHLILPRKAALAWALLY